MYCKRVQKIFYWFYWKIVKLCMEILNWICSKNFVNLSNWHSGKNFVKVCNILSKKLPKLLNSWFDESFDNSNIQCALKYKFWQNLRKMTEFNFIKFDENFQKWCWFHKKKLCLDLLNDMTQKQLFLRWLKLNQVWICDYSVTSKLWKNQPIEKWVGEKSSFWKPK